MSIRLLADVRELWTGECWGERVLSETIRAALVRLEGRPWSELNRGKPMTANRLARLLRRFGIVPKNQRQSDSIVRKGYDRRDFADAFARYLEPPPDGGARQNPPFQTATSATDLELRGNSPERQPLQPPSVAVSENGKSTNDLNAVAAVAVANPAPGLAGGVVAGSGPGDDDEEDRFPVARGDRW